jgi:hypothetical protein
MLQTLFNYGSAEASTPSCPRCSARLPFEDINVQADAAFCRSCGAVCRFSDLLPPSPYDAAHPSAGASFHATSDGFLLHASTRSVQAVFLVPFFVFWSGLSLNSIYGTQVRQGVFDFSRSLFGVPFVIGTILLGIQAVLSVCGHIRISRRADRGTVFQGVGRVGWARSFRWSDLNYVREERVASGRSSYQAIVLRFKPGARGKLRFGRLLSDERREFLISMLRSQIANSEPSSRLP